MSQHLLLKSTEDKDQSYLLGFSSILSSSDQGSPTVPRCSPSVLFWQQKAKRRSRKVYFSIYFVIAAANPIEKGIFTLV